MNKSLEQIITGYKAFKKGYFADNKSMMEQLSNNGQKPKIMVISCCDSRVDPGVMLQCTPGDLFVVRNVANIVPPFEADDSHHGTSAALEFAIKALKVKHLIILGHSQCGGIQALLDNKGNNNPPASDFIDNWVSIINPESFDASDTDGSAKKALHQSYQNCLSFPWLKDAVNQKELAIHLWFFDIKSGQIVSYSDSAKEFQPLETSTL